MPLTRTRKLAYLVAAGAVLLFAILLAARFFSPAESSSRQQLLRLVPADSTAVVFFDLDELRASPFLAKLYAWAPQPAQDSEYQQFVHDTGFSYERDLLRVVLAFNTQGPSTTLFAVADGNFDRKKIEAFLLRNGTALQQAKWKVYRLSAAANKQPLSLTFLSNSRVALCDCENLVGILSAPANAGQAEWNPRFDRLGGTPLFAVIRQDSALQNAMNAATPGGFRSPELATLLGQLQWISISGKPNGDQLRVVVDGETLAPQTATQLRELLQGIQLMAQAGLNDPKLRQKMNPEERQAYLEILNGADIQKVDRSEWESVRVVLSISPAFLDMARTATTAPAQPALPPVQQAAGKTTAHKAKPQGKK